MFLLSGVSLNGNWARTGDLHCGAVDGLLMKNREVKSSGSPLWPPAGSVSPSALAVPGPSCRTEPWCCRREL